MRDKNGRFAAKKTQLDRIEQTLDMLDAFLASTIPVIMDRLKAIEGNVTAHELGLTPEAEPPLVEEWVPKVGDLVVALPTKERKWSLGLALDIGSHPIRVQQIDPIKSGSGWGVLVQGRPKTILHIDYRNFRPATPAEIQAHEAAIAERERKDKEGKLKFGCHVEYQDNQGWRVAQDKPSPAGFWLLTKTDEARLAWVKADELTIID